MTETGTLTEREEIEALLPWYVTGRLSAADRRRVDAFLETDPALRRQLPLIEEDRAALVALNEALHAPRTLTADNLLARLPRSPVTRLTGLLAPVRSFLAAPTAMGVRWAAATGLALIVAQGLVISALWLSRPGDQVYETASGPAARVLQGTTALVRFAPGASLEALAAELAKRDMRIVDGPKPGQLFVVSIGPADMAAAEKTRREAELKALHGLVVLVLPSGGGG